MQLVSFIGIVIVMQWLMYKVFLFIGAFQAIKGFASITSFSTPAHLLCNQALHVSHCT